MMIAVTNLAFPTQILCDCKSAEAELSTICIVRRIFKHGSEMKVIYSCCENLLLKSFVLSSINSNISLTFINVSCCCCYCIWFRPFSHITHISHTITYSNTTDVRIRKYIFKKCQKISWNNTKMGEISVFDSPSRNNIELKNKNKKFWVLSV